MIKLKLLFPIIVIALLTCNYSFLSAQEKINLDTLTHDQLKIYREKAVKMKTTGWVLLVGGTMTLLTSYLVVNHMAKNSSHGFRTTFNNASAVLSICGIVGISSGVTGTFLIIAGNNRISKSDIALENFNSRTNNSMAFGIGSTLKF